MPLPARYQDPPSPLVYTSGPTFVVSKPKVLPTIPLPKIAKTTPTTLASTSGWCPVGLQTNVGMGRIQKGGDTIQSSTAAWHREEATSLEVAMQKEQDTTTLVAALQEKESTTLVEAAQLEDCIGLPPRLAPPSFCPLLARLKPPTVQRWGRTAKKRERPLSQSRNPLPGAAKATDEPGRGERRRTRQMPQVSSRITRGHLGGKCGSLHAPYPLLCLGPPA